MRVKPSDKTPYRIDAVRIPLCWSSILTIFVNYLTTRYDIRRASPLSCYLHQIAPPKVCGGEQACLAFPCGKGLWLDSGLWWHGRLPVRAHGQFGKARHAFGFAPPANDTESGANGRQAATSSAPSDPRSPEPIASALSAAGAPIPVRIPVARHLTHTVFMSMVWPLHHRQGGPDHAHDCSVWRRRQDRHASL